MGPSEVEIQEDKQGRNVGSKKRLGSRNPSRIPDYCTEDVNRRHSPEGLTSSFVKKRMLTATSRKSKRAFSGDLPNMKAALIREYPTESRKAEPIHSLVIRSSKNTSN